MPDLEIFQTDIDHPTPVSVACVAAAMRFPRDDAKREGFIDAARATDIPRRIAAGQYPAHPKDEKWANDEVAVLAARLIELPRTSDYGTFVEKEHLHGFIAGWITEQFYKAGAEGEKLTKRDLLDRIDAHHEIRVKHITSKTINDVIWPRYAPVAHLWGAYDDSLTDDQLPPFPCSPGDLPWFLAYAEEMRTYGEGHQLSASHTLLDADKTFRISPDITLPNIR